MRLKLALALVGAFAVIVVSGASAADFEGDNGACRETPGEAELLRCPTAYVGEKYEIEIESEEGSGCSPIYDYFLIVNSTLPAGLTMSRDGVISGVPTSAGFTRFWIHNHDLTEANGGPDWCDRDDVSEREFSIYVDPGLAIDNESVEGATIGAAYSETFTAKRIVTLNPPTGSEAAATWSLQSGALPQGITLTSAGVLSGTTTSEGSYGFVVKAQDGSASDTKDYTLSVLQPLSVKSPFGPARPPTSEVGIRLAKTFTATGGSGPYTWAVASGALPPGVVLDGTKGIVAGTPQKAGAFAFSVTATDSEGRVTTSAAALTVAPRLMIKTLRLKPATVASAYQVTLATRGGVHPVKWSVVRGKLPAGLKLSQTTGTISGTPRKSGSFRVTLGARDVLGAKSQKTLVIRVTA